MSPQLAHIVQCCWSREKCGGELPSGDVIHPQASVELILHAGRAHAQPGPPPILPEVFVVAPHREPLSFATFGSALLLGVRLYPWVLPELLRDAVPLEWPVCVSPALASLAHRALPELTAGQVPAALEAVEGWLLGRFAEMDARLPTSATIQEVYRRRGRVLVSTLAELTGHSTRHVERSFLETVGMPPKVFSGLVRFEHARHALLSSRQISLADLALDLGYTDQAHLTRDFQRWARRSPGAFRLANQRPPGR